MKTGPVGTYRPKARAEHQGTIIFRDASSTATLTSGSSVLGSIDGLHDAFTGAPLDARRGLYRCQSCQVYYHPDSYAILTEENGGRCIACLGTSLVSISQTSSTFQPGRDHAADTVTLQDYHLHVGTVVTFEGHVPRINTSRDGRNYAVMFENTSWAKGLKLVVFKGNLAAVGGRDFLLGLKGRTVRVRGLLIKHPISGYEIIVSERGMILGVK